MGKRKRLYTRFFMSLTTISVCCILVLAVVIFFWYRNISIANVNKANRNVLLNTETVFKNYKEIVQNYTMDFYANPNINALMMNGDTSWSDQLYSALSQIKGALVVNQYLENAYIFGVDEPVAMFENMPLSPESKLQLAERMRDSRIVESPFLWDAALNNGTPVKLMTVFYNDRAFADSEYYGAVALTVNLSKLQNNLFTQTEGETTRYAVLDRNGTVLMHSALSGDPLETAMTNQIVDSALEQGSFVYKGGGEARLVTFVYSPKDKLWFMSDTPYKDSIRDISSARNLMITLCLALIAAAAVVSGLISRQMYQPIGRLFGNILHLSGNEEALKRGGDFASASQELEMIGARLNQLKKESDDSALMRWLLSPRRAPDESVKPNMSLGTAGGAYCVCVLAVMEELPAPTLQQICGDAVAQIRTEFSGLAAVQAFHPHEGSAVLILSELHSGSLGDYALYRSNWEALAVGLTQPGVRCALGISGLTDDLSLLKPNYIEAANGLHYVKFLEQRNIVFADDTIHLNSSPVPDSTLEPVLQSVRLPEQRSHIPQAVERLLAVVTGYRIELAIIAVCRLAQELERTAGPGSEIRHSGFLDYYQAISQLQSYDKLRGWLEECCYTAAGRIDGMSAVQSRSVAAEAIIYIRERYNDPGLSLNSLAQKLSLSPAYLSRLIAEEVGCSFPDFVNLVRLEQAELLLVNELGLDIRDIAGKVGYNSSTYFTTQFKKRYGVTPSKWRMSHILRQQD
ncbi:AraC family transcriptional regulator [Paenibacillus camerounensis]|uniref:AraC family transcriptional regulator n=1 Tax=Paenibacillus camerounensis TaxID=1243663 RepID=UPI000B2EDCEF|nr:AraC family transcriptional regulator [Paenibacillus camerounensis]